MRNVNIKLLIAFLLFSLSAKSFANMKTGIDATVNSFKEFKENINKEIKNKDLSHSLIVMDDDDTLTMMKCTDQKNPKKCQYIGGPAWYSWQSSLIEKPDSIYKIANSKKQLENISSLLLSINNMPYTDKNIPNILSELVSKGAKLLVLTARGSSDSSATENQFSKLNIIFKNKNESFLKFIQSHSLTGKKNNISSLAGSFSPLKKGIPVSYQKGIMYVSGQNKGTMLEALLARTNSEKINNIFFIDDTQHNVKDVYHSFKNISKYNTYAYYYTKLASHKSALTEPKNNIYQAEAMYRWLTLKNALSTALLDPTISIK
ncbi:DUF2608 domain-containing protein [Celerinatantimonas diazotrophica]|uniref:Uncharacterized protein DUF2608 n=1 Tax=Celerinatantimonas diazotrophica TaxID=412034 RepID=A0A4R1K4X9_9GAMM|nr:DUF2608 domain-containing protein [Celerinatantimonas diazotrophica]TCK58079.1 uncharacterized protein DUF2608 [Celerinatantimonas diazotrophica]CAG9297852.1 hypothetical protein CEDIAZO_03044 [Celerinatantimonas diazotrophica]